jgi:hypothetical protein
MKGPSRQGYFRIVCVLCNQVIQNGKRGSGETAVSVCDRCKEKLATQNRIELAPTPENENR